MNLLKMLKPKEKQDEKQVHNPPPPSNKWIDDALEAARGRGAVRLWKISYRTSLEHSSWDMMVEGTAVQICRFILSQPGDLQYFTASVCETPKVLRN